MTSLSAITTAQEIQLQVPDRRYDVPDGLILEPPNTIKVTEEMKCYSVEDYKTVAHIIIDYRWLYDALIQAQIALNAERQKNEILHQEIKLLNEDILVLRTANDKLSWLLDKQLDAANKEITGDRLKLYVVAAVAILELVAIGALGTAYGIQR